VGWLFETHGLCNNLQGGIKIDGKVGGEI